MDQNAGTTERLPRAASVGAAGSAEPSDEVHLDHSQRAVRRRRLVTRGGASLLVDLPRTTALADGDLLLLEDGRAVRVVAAAEPLLEVSGDLPRLAWHLGNRHCPAEIGAEALRIRADPVLAEMLRGLGARCREVSAPFEPEGGAYGTGSSHHHHL